MLLELIKSNDTIKSMILDFVENCVNEDPLTQYDPYIRVSYEWCKRIKYEQFGVFSNKCDDHSISYKAILYVGIPNAPDNFPEIYVHQYLIGKESAKKIEDFLLSVHSLYREEKIDQLFN